MQTIAFLNKKGGVGKTSTVFHLSSELGARGLRVLVVDIDPQASLTQGLLGPARSRTLPGEQTIAGLFNDASPADPIRLVIPTNVPGVSLLPGSEAMEDYNETRPHATGPLQAILRDALAEVADGFDLCLVDCPPSVQLCSWSALVAADAVLVPLQAEDFGAQGVASIQQSILRIQQGPNRRLRLLGFLLTMYQKTLGVHRAYEADLRAMYGDAVFSVVVPHVKDFKEAVQLRKPVGLYKPRSAAAKVVVTLADELLARLSIIPVTQEEAA